MTFCNSSIVWSETHNIDVMVELENSDVTYPEQVKCYSKKNSRIIGDGMRKEIDGERERIAKTIAENLGTEMRTVNILSVRLLPLDLELERKNIKKEMKMNKKAKKVHTEKEYSFKMNSGVTYPEQVKCYSKKNWGIIGDGMRKEIDGERERIAKTIAENLGTEMRTVNILSVRLPPLDLELERKIIKKEMKMNKKAKKVHTEKEYSIYGPGRELDIQRSLDVQAMENKQNEITFGPRSHEPNREDKMKTKAIPDTEKETSVPGTCDSGQNPQFENNVQANSMVNVKKQINSFTSQQPQTTARGHSTGHLYLKKVPRKQVSSKDMVQSMPARREAVCDFTSDIHYQGKTQARVIFKRFGEDFESGNVRLAAQAASNSNMKRSLSLKSVVFKR